MVRDHHPRRIIDPWGAIIILALVILECIAWKLIFMGDPNTGAHLYFLGVTQGESTLLALPRGAVILTDAGSDDMIVRDLSASSSIVSGPYIDLAVISYPESADYKGFSYLLDHYSIGALIYNGRSDAVHKSDWTALMDKIAARHIPLITLGAGDRIRYGTTAEIDILSPDTDFAHSADPRDTGIVERIRTPRFSALLAADIGTNTERALLAKKIDVRADVLKAPFPGLIMPQGGDFLRAVAPGSIMIAAGTKNTPSQPSRAALKDLASSTKATLLRVSSTFVLYNK